MVILSFCSGFVKSAQWYVLCGAWEGVTRATVELQPPLARLSASLPHCERFRPPPALVLWVLQSGGDVVGAWQGLCQEVGGQCQGVASIDPALAGSSTESAHKMSDTQIPIKEFHIDSMGSPLNLLIIEIWSYRQEGNKEQGNWIKSTGRRNIPERLCETLIQLRSLARMVLECLC